MNREQHERNTYIVRARRKNWTVTVWTKHNIQPETIYNGFPKKEPVKLTDDQAQRYDHIFWHRRVLHYRTTQAFTDRDKWGRILA